MSRENILDFLFQYKEIEDWLDDEYPDTHPEFPGGNPRNAIVHALMIAILAYRHGPYYSQVLGDLREHRTAEAYYNGTGTDERRDTYRDLYNNQVGRTIAEFARANGLDEADLQLLVEEAARSNLLISSVNSPFFTVPPAVDGTFWDRPEDGFTGYPHQFELEDNVWEAPHNLDDVLEPRVADWPRFTGPSIGATLPSTMFEYVNAGTTTAGLPNYGAFGVFPMNRSPMPSADLFRPPPRSAYTEEWLRGRPQPGPDPASPAATIPVVNVPQFYTGAFVPAPRPRDNRFARQPTPASAPAPGSQFRSPSAPDPRQPFKLDPALIPSTTYRAIP